MSHPTVGSADGVLAALAAALEPTDSQHIPPVHLWHPATCGDINIVIRSDGVWLYEGRPIKRQEMVRLFSRVLRKDPDGVHLVTPVEKLRITVEDAPFVAVAVDQTFDPYRTPLLTFRTNVGDLVVAGRDHPIRVTTAADGTPRPYIHIRHGLDALIARPVFYDLVDLASMRPTSAGPQMGVKSDDAWFPLAPPNPELGRDASPFCAPSRRTAYATRPG